MTRRENEFHKSAFGKIMVMQLNEVKSMTIKTKQQAMREARKRWGNNAAVEDSGWRASRTEEERQIAHQEIRKVREQIKEIEKRHYEELSELRKKKEELMVTISTHQYSVGEISNLGGFSIFRVKGYGDSWDEAFDKADK